MDLTEATVVVTGGATGIGAAFVEGFLSAGAAVCIADVDDDAGHALVERLGGDGRVVFERADVTDEAGVEEMAGRVHERFGGPHVLVNNAAMYRTMGRKKRFDEISADEWDLMMAVNVRGVWQCTKSVVPYMRQQGGGKVVNISSGVFHFGSTNFAHYVASKGAVIGLTRALARELGGDNITVNSIAPGLVENETTTMMNDPRFLEWARSLRAIPRAMKAKDLVGAALFLASEASDFITGQTLIVDGGMVMQ